MHGNAEQKNPEPHSLQRYRGANACSSVYLDMPCVCVCVCVVQTSEGLSRPLIAPPVTLASKQEGKYVRAACHSQIVQRFLYGWLEYERMCQS